MAMRKLRRLMPFLTGDTQNLASEALQDLYQWSMQFWGDVVFLVESDQEEENQGRATSGEQPGLPGEAPGALPQPPVGALPHDPARPLLPHAGRLRQAAQAPQEPRRHSPPTEGTGPLPRPADGALQQPPELPPPPGDARGCLLQPAEERGELAELPPLQHGALQHDQGLPQLPTTTTPQKTTEEDRQVRETTGRPEQPLQELRPRRPRRPQPGAPTTAHTTFGSPPRQRPLPQRGALLQDQGLPQLPATTTQQETTEEERPGNEATGGPGQPPRELRPQRRGPHGLPSHGNLWATTWTATSVSTRSSTTRPRTTSTTRDDDTTGDDRRGTTRERSYRETRATSTRTTTSATSTRGTNDGAHSDDRGTLPGRGSRGLPSHGSGAGQRGSRNSPVAPANSAVADSAGTTRRRSRPERK